jgi:prolyl oligopeptidase
MRRVAKAEYPEARQAEHVDVLHGVEVPDPYRWLEDVNSDETAAWVDAQHRLTQSVLDTIPFRQAIREQLDQLSLFESVGVPVEASGRMFFTLQAADARQPTLCWSDIGSDEAHVLLDPATLADDATISIDGFTPSPCGRLLAYGLAEAGSDWQTWRVLDVDSGAHLPDRLEWLKFPMPSWTPDSSGFYYGSLEPPPPGETYKAPVTKRSLRFHRLGELQDEDAVLFERPDEPMWLFRGQVTTDGRYLVIPIQRGTYRETRISYIDLESPKADVVDLISEFEASFQFLGNDDRSFFFLTTHDAPLGRIVAIDLDHPEPEAWTELVPESDAVLQMGTYVGGRFVVSALCDAVGRVTVYDRNGAAVREVPLPGDGTVGLLLAREDGKVGRFAYADFVHPNVVLQHDVETGETVPFRAPDLPYDVDRYVTERLEVESSDGTRFPVFLARRADIVAGPETPTCLYGYGGYNIPVSPHFRIDFLSWMDFGGQLAVACIRGGGEFGRAWHQAGARENRPNVFADFIAAAEALIETGRCSKDKLAIYGRSNGGLLVGACMTKRPDLFGACLPTVGVLDMLRFHKFTVGAYWVSDYGSPDDPEMFPILLGYSPLHNVKDGTAYPPTLVATADHDDRVFPAHSHKFAAALQAVQAGENPILLRIDRRAGHGLGKPKGKLLDEVADRWSFAFSTLGSEPSIAG